MWARHYPEHKLALWGDGSVGRFGVLCPGRVCLHKGQLQRDSLIVVVPVHTARHKAQGNV